MTLPVSNVPVAAPAAPTAQTQTTSLIPAKKLNDAPQQDQMTLPSQSLGPIEAPQSTQKFSISNTVNQKHAEAKDIWDSATKPLASSSLGATKKKSGLLSNLIKIAAAVTVAVLVGKKIKLSSVDSGNIADLSGIKKHFDNIVNTAKNGKLKPFNLKKSCIRVVDETADDIKDILKTTRKVASEAKNVEGKTPKIVVKLTNDAGDIQKTIEEAIKANKIDGLDESILKKMEYINLEYVKSDPSARNIIIKTMSSDFTGEAGAVTEGISNIGKMFKSFFKD